MPTLELKDVSKRFKSETVLEHVNLSVADGETVAIFGPSGAGKTVLLRLVAGVEDTSDGGVLIDGVDVADVPPDKRGVGMAFQNFALFPHMTAFENIASPLRVERSTVEAVSDGVHAVARLLKIDHVLDHAPRALSNGQKQRTSLARALANNPGILLLDDPLRNVDAKLRFEMRLELPRLLSRQGSTVLFVTQDYKEAMAVGERIAVLEGGGFVQIGTPEEIYLSPATTGVARLFGDPTINLLNVQPEVVSGNVHAEVAGARLALPFDSTQVGETLPHDCLLGVRPETLTFCAPDVNGALPLTVEATTPLNEKVVTLLSGPDETELLVSRPSNETAPAAGASVHVRVPPAAALLFDSTSGALLAVGGQGA